MSTNIRIQFACACILAFIVVSCNSDPLAKEPAVTSSVEQPSPSPNALLESTPDSLVEEPTEQPQPTVQILEEPTGQPQPTAQILERPIIVPTVDINTMNINLKQELYFTGGAEQGDSLSPCTRQLFMKYEVSFESESQFLANGIVPSKLKEVRALPYFLGTVDGTLNLCIYAFPEDEIITVELHTPEDNLCASWDVRVSDYYYLAVGDITIVDFATDWPRCSHAGLWSVVVKSASASVTEPVEIAWEQMAKLGVSGSCDISTDYISVKGVGYPPGETRFLGVYGTCSSYGETDRYGYGYTCELLQSYLIEIDKAGSFDVSLPSNLSGDYIVVPIIGEPSDYGGHEFLLSPGVIHYPKTCDYARDLYLTDPTLKGEDVENVQQRLWELGYFEVGPVDGDFGPKTESAVLVFQQMNGLHANGIVDEATRNALFGDDAISRPHERNLYVTTPRLNGDDVVAVQQRLVDLGYVEVGEVDGYYGSKTESGVLRFQKVNKLSENGMVDEQTWNAIFGADAIPGW